MALGCRIVPFTSLPATFTYQTTNSANILTGTPNTPVSIAVGGAQSFVFAFTPTAAFAPVEAQLRFDCTNTLDAPLILKVNTLLLSASNTPVPDIVALAATLNNDGFANIPGTMGTGVFSVATANVGVGGQIMAVADTGGVNLSASPAICQTNPSTGCCLGGCVVPTTSSVPTQINAGATPTFGVFVKGNGTVPCNVATNRIFVNFKDSQRVTRGRTSVAGRTSGQICQ